jgi:hypothetical protein
MGQRASITLTDAASTPVNHVFAPTSQKGDVLFYNDRTATSVAIGQNVLSLQQKTPSKSSKNTRFSWKLTCPTLEQTSPSTSTGIQPAPTLAYNNIVTLDLIFNERATQQERKDALAMMRDLIDEAIVTNEANDLEITY